MDHSSLKKSERYHNTHCIIVIIKENSQKVQPFCGNFQIFQTFDDFVFLVAAFCAKVPADSLGYTNLDGITAWCGQKGKRFFEKCRNLCNYFFFSDDKRRSLCYNDKVYSDLKEI
ncbi:MAG: hypothetical protein IJU56_10045 [Clostridia bacterium]|nr:hypothetical protein [Clostridia bacterium]